MIFYLLQIIGEANVTIKDSIFQASSPMLHAAEFASHEQGIGKKPRDVFTGIHGWRPTPQNVVFERRGILDGVLHYELL
jgi:hypothetical protein